MQQGSTLFSKPTRLTRQKDFSLYELFDCTEIIINKKHPPYDDFFNILRNGDPLEKDYKDFENLVQSGLSREQVLGKLWMDDVPPTGADNYAFLQNIWDNENMQSVEEFLKEYNKKDIVSTLEAMQTMIEFYHNKVLDMLKLGCTIAILAKIFYK